MGTPLFRPLAPLPLAAAAPGAGPLPQPPHPPDRRVVVLLVALLTALLFVGLPPRPASGVVGVGMAGAPAVGPGPGRAWPVGGPGSLLQRFDPPPVRWAAGHRGVDLAASVGATVRAAAPGVISFSGMVAGRPVVTVTHPASGSPPLRTTYLPVTGSVPVGTAVAGGEPIGVLATGVGHCATGCLHWGLLRGKRYLDPLALLGTGQARLLPFDGPVTQAQARLR
ncbi:murein hydrolase activator EnvC family protein [Kitasatospora sp. NPDC101801]|uniref:murein hydrolase activator EnvC family protein n=1 Tax=Kitasatospora sp. NPDC101801 TaxID=3364103 RepID=UPI00382B3560